jgi:hypothetical protein
MLATLFWYSPTIKLSPQVAVLTGGSNWVNPDGLTLNPGGGWGYGSSASPSPSVPNGANQGISSVGLSIDLFGDGNFSNTPGFSAAYLNGDDYDILPQLGVNSKKDNPFAGKYPLAKDSMTLTLLLPDGVTNLDISNVSFHYGSGIKTMICPPQPTRLYPAAFCFWAQASWVWACWAGGGREVKASNPSLTT